MRCAAYPFVKKRVRHLEIQRHTVPDHFGRSECGVFHRGIGIQWVQGVGRFRCEKRMVRRLAWREAWIWR
jgi:hypothetical protein